MQRANGKLEQPDEPPWVVGWRGVAREAPENTLAGLRRALELALDGLAYDVRACAGGDLVLCADASLDRTTDARGLVAQRTLAELYGVDAGGWFGKRFAGEPIPTLEEALAVLGNPGGSVPQHVIVLHDPAGLAELARAIHGAGRHLSVRVASSSSAVCMEARDLDLAAMWIVDRPTDEVRRFARDERIAAVAARLAGWPLDSRGESWPCERWLLGVDDPEELLRACRAPINGVITSEPRRALALRALTRLAPHDVGVHPLIVPELDIEPGAALPSEATWCGAWSLGARIRNPFGSRARVTLALVVRRGAFEASGLPASIELAPGEERESEFRLSGGSWSPGGDPVLVATYRLDDGTELALDATLARVRRLTLFDTAMRVELVRESPDAPTCTVNLRRRGRDLLAAIEQTGDLEDARISVHLDGVTWRGARGLRLRLPLDFDRRTRGVAFSVGIEGRRRGASGWRHALARWAGGLPSELDAGAHGRLYSASVR